MDNFQGSKSFYNKYKNQILFSSKNINKSSPVILSAGEFNRYIQLQNHQQLIDISHKYGKKNCLCESRINSSKANLFFDYDCKDQLSTFPDAMKTIDDLKAKIKAIFPQLIVKFYVKDSLQPDNDELINSLHIITHLSTSDGHSIYFDYSNGCSQIKFFVSKLGLEHPFDHKQAYSGHLLRLLHSNKFDKSGKLSNRIFNESDMSDIQDDPLKSLSSYCPNPKFMLVSDYVNSNFILQYVKNQQYAKDYLFEHIKQRDNESHLSLTLTEQKTPLCTHKSNNAVCMFYNHSENPNIIIKCQDEECGKFVQSFFQYDNNQYRCQISITGDNSSDKQQERLEQAASNTVSTSTATHSPASSSDSSPEYQKDRNIMQNISFALNKVFLDKFGLELDNIKSIDNQYFLATAKSPQHASSQESREFTGQEKKIYFRKTLQGRIETINQPKELQKALSKIYREFNSQQIAQYNVQYNQFDNSVHYHYHTTISKDEKDDVVYDDEFNDIEFKSSKHRQYFTNIINGELQFVTEIYNLEYPDQFLYVYDDKDNGQIMFFDNLDKSKQNQTDGGFWNMQGGFKNAKSKIRNYVVELFNGVINQLNSKDKRRKIVQYKLNQTRNDIYNNIRLDQHLSETYEHREIEFNNNPHLLHFQNGTFDLDQHKFIKTTPEMYNTFQIDYDYDPSVKYDEMYEQLSQIMLKNEFQWFLKQLSNCLNPNKVIESKQFVILSGFGDNGKTILCKLMTHTLGTQAYAYNGRHHMVQTQNNSSTNATPDFAKLLNKRFCYIAELDNKVSFNQQQVKILTGGEEIQARDLYKSLTTFQPSAGMFISCNQIPYIDTSDGGFINRLKIIDLKYKFVDNPAHKFQKPINQQLPLLVKSIQWKQGFMNLLIHTYYKSKVELPKSIQKSIDLRVNLQKNPIHDWAQDNTKLYQGNYILAETLLQKYLEDTNNQIKITSFSKQLTDYFYSQPEDFSDVVYEKIDKKKNKNNEIIRGRGFTNLDLVSNE